MRETNGTSHQIDVCVYALGFRGTRHIYIGQTIKLRHRIEFEHRAKLRQGKHENPYLQRAWNCYGEENFTIDILWRMPFEDTEILGRARCGEVSRCMEASIAYGMIDAGINIMNMREFDRWGGVSAPASNPEVAKRVSEKLKAIRGDATKNAKILESTHSEAANEKRGASMRKHWRDGVTRQKFNATWEAKRLARPKIEKPAPTGRFNGTSTPRRVICVETGVTYQSIGKAAKETGATNSGIPRAIKRGIKCGGYSWKYA